MHAARVLRIAYRSRKASKYMTQRHGTICQSILAISLRSVVVVSGGRSADSL
jgi:hypothetical protein